MAEVSFVHKESKPGSLVQHGGGIRKIAGTEEGPDYLSEDGGGIRVISLEENKPLRGLSIPEIVTGPAIDVGRGNALLNGTLNDDRGLPCVCAFEWGLTDRYGFTTPFQEVSSGEVFNETLTGLLPDTVYHFRTVSWNAFGGSYGFDQIFRTTSESVKKPLFQRTLFFLLIEDD